VRTHAVLNDLLLAVLSLRFLVRANADQAGQSANSCANTSSAANRTEYCPSGGAADCANPGIFGFSPVIAHATRLVLARRKISIVLRVGVASHVDNRPVIGAGAGGQAESHTDYQR
jgi:hypothetical protein